MGHDGDGCYLGLVSVGESPIGVFAASEVQRVAAPPRLLLATFRSAGHVCFGNVFGLFPFRCGLFSFFFGWLSVAVEWRQLTFSERNLDLGLARFVAAALRFYLEAAASRRSLLFISMGTNTLLTRASNVQYVT